MREKRRDWRSAGEEEKEVVSFGVVKVMEVAMASECFVVVRCGWEWLVIAFSLIFIYSHPILLIYIY